ncbi:putative callose synthase 8 isoform X2 [Amaranthus tricolor]|nr:putative callose synthase 8 isoform X2 [Amaranthus tricolor]
MDEFKKLKTSMVPFDIFDWLGFVFGFQNGNIANQREHLTLLLANTHIRNSHKQTSVLVFADGALDGLMRKFFKNYTKWCKFLGRKSNIRLPYVKQEAQQYKLLYIALYLLIWGEAANLRLMPECLCYIYHHMAYELHSMLTDAVSLMTWEKVMPAYGGENKAFLNNVVRPIYNVIAKEAEKSKNGTADHSKWRNYDDLNEFFWSPKCFEIGWPMHSDPIDGHDFFYVKNKSHGDQREVEAKNSEVNFLVRLRKLCGKKVVKDEEQGEIADKGSQKTWLGKTNFVEIRSFLQIFRSFDRMWTFLILALQALIIISCHNLSSPLQLIETNVLEDIISIFITSAVLKVIRATLDIAFTWKARKTMDSSQILKFVVRLIIAMVWMIILPVLYVNTRRKYTCYSIRRDSVLGDWCYSSYMVAVVVYLMGNAVDVILFFVPPIGRYIETSNDRICAFLSWWTQPRLYVGRGMQEDQVSSFKYMLFWVLLLLSKLSFSYYLEIKPLIEPTRQMMRIHSHKYEWHELFPHVKSNAGALVAVWAPILLVYFMDTQIWYSVFCAIFGGVYGILHHLGEIRTLGMLRSRFKLLPSGFNACLIPQVLRNNHDRKNKGLFSHLKKEPGNNKSDAAKFAIMWNQIILSFRQEDLINNRERDLMVMPLSSELLSGHIRWPVFLLTNELSTALSIAKDFVGKDEDLIKKIKKVSLRYSAVKECYNSFKNILGIIAVGELEKRMVSGIIAEIEESIKRSTLLEDIKMSVLPALHATCVKLFELLVEGNEHQYFEVVKVLQDMFELVTNGMMINGSRTLDMLNSSQQDGDHSAYFTRKIQPELFASKNAIHFPLAKDGALYDQIKRFLLLLTIKDKALDIPANLEARRRICYFATSLFMNMPAAPKVRNMMSFSVLTPHYEEEVKFSMKELLSSQEQVSIIFYMKKIYPDDWKNFLERMGCDDLDALKSRNKEDQLRNWASFRGQTLSRTVRGMMYYKKALKLQAFLDMAEDRDILQGYEAMERGNDTLSAQLDALTDMKFTYVVTWQMYGSCKATGDPRAQDMLDLMTRYPALRVAYVEERELISEQETDTVKSNKKTGKVYSSVLVKGGVNGHDQEVYRIELPGPPNIGEGKPENQNHAIIFTRGEALQTIDMNQDNYLEEAYKMRNVLQEFMEDQGNRTPTIVGLREHVFTGSVSSLAWFMSYQETSFVTIGQRILANPLRVRFHYGHPDIFDRIFHITRGGISKASRTINLSEDVFAGFNSVLRRGCVTYREYIQVGKGRDVGLIQISKFEAKVANGNSEQTLTRDIHRLGQRFDVFRMLSCYHTTIGFYFSNLISVISIYVFLYGQLYLVLSGLQKALIIEARVHNVQSLETALASQSFIQLGLLTGLPMVMEIALERGFYSALKDFVLIQLQLASVFFTFSFGAKSHYYGRTILHGGAKYRPTGRKVVIFHATFSENYRLYSRSHFVKGFELLLLLIVYDLYRKSYQSSMAYLLITYAIWFLSLTWLFAPFLFNPYGFDWQILVNDWTDWNKWIRQQGGIGIPPDKSWQSWWYDEQEHIRRSRWSSRLIEIILSLRFFVYQYGLVYQLNISKNSGNFTVYVLSWVVVAVIFLLVKLVNIGRHWLSANHQFLYRLFKACLFLAVVSTIISLSLVFDLSILDLVVCCLAFLPTGWGLILIAQTLRPLIENTGIWDFARVFARAYDFSMGVALFGPIALFSWLPITSAFQNQFLFNEAFSRRLQIKPILDRKKKRT